MVWALLPVDPLSGEEKYYIFGQGIYKVGRKGCDIIINKDKGVSRVHAEIVVDAMTSMNPLHMNSDLSSNVRVRDCSKYGTFLNKNMGSGEKVHEFPSREATLKDGDLVSFGTGNATYRFSFVALIFFSSGLSQLLEQKVASIGACLTHASHECTHMLVDDLMSVQGEIFDAIIGKKPLVLPSWVELLAQTRICSEIPNWSSYAPTLSVQGVLVKVADSKTRGNCLSQYSFLLESTDKYFSGNRLPSLLKVGGATAITEEEFCSNSQGLEYGEDNHVVFVVPKGAVDKFNSKHKFGSLSRMNEVDLICSILSGHLNPSMLISPDAVVVLSSCSTDETVVADSDEEVDTVTSTLATTHEDPPKNISRVEISMDQAANKLAGSHAISTLATTHEDPPKNISRVEISMDQAANKLAGSNAISPGKTSGGMIGLTKKIDESGSSDVIYSQDLVVRSLNFPVPVNSFTSENSVLDFKRFKKVNVQSGNSFSNLIPFAKYPYTDSDLGREDVSEFVKEEKKRKRMEAIADDLFNNQKGKRVAGSLHGLLTRG